MPHMKVPEIKCPVCSAVMDGATSAYSSVTTAPDKGDISICFYCATVLIYLDVKTVTIAKDNEVPDVVKRIRQHLIDFIAKRTLEGAN